MKKLILIPSILIAGLTPTISLVGCKNDNQGDKPEPEPAEVKITPGPTNMVDTMEVTLGESRGLRATLPGFKIENAKATDLIIRATSDAWLTVGDIVVSVEVNQQISETEQEFSVVLTMEDYYRLQIGDIYQINIYMLLGGKLIFSSDQYRVNVKEKLSAWPAEGSTQTLTYLEYQYCYWANFDGFLMDRINEFFAQSTIWGQEYRVTFYELDGKTKIDYLHGSYSGVSTTWQNVEIWCLFNLPVEEIQFRIGITRAYVGGEDICTILHPFNSEIYKLRQSS